MIEYAGIKQLCSSCYGKYPKRAYQSRKILWIDYVKRFVEENEYILEELFCRWINILVDEEKANR